MWNKNFNIGECIHYVLSILNTNEPEDVIKNWLRAKTNIEFLALWEHMHNPNVKGVEIDTFKSEAGTHYFTMSPQRWIKETNTKLIDNYSFL